MSAPAAGTPAGTPAAAPATPAASPAEAPLRVLRVSAAGFGVLRGEVVLDPERLNVVVGDNERGKTTLAAAIAAALYGLDADARHWRGRFTPQQQFEPWGGGAYAVEVVFEAGGRRYTVNRHFGRGSITVFEDGRGDVTEEFRTGANEYPIGEQLLGLTVDQFARSALWLQEGPGRLAGEGVRPDGSLSPRLESQASSVAGDVSAQVALATLEDAVQKYARSETRIQVGSHARRLEAQLVARREELQGEERRLEEAGLALGELARVRAREEQLESDRRRAAWHALAAGADEAEALLERDAQARRGFEEMRAELTRLRGIPPVAAGASEELRQARAELDAAAHTLEELAARRAAGVEGPRREIEAGLAARRALAWAAPVHLEEIAALEGEIVRAREGGAQARQKRAELEAELARAGVRVDRLEELRARFGKLGPEDADRLAGAPAARQAEVAESEKARRAESEARAALERIDAERRARSGGGLALVGLGLAAGGFAVWLALRGQITAAVAGLAATFAALAAGTALVGRARVHRAGERQVALRALTDANRRLQQLHEQAAARTLALADLAHRAGCATSEALLADHAAYLRVVREADRLAWVSEDLAGLARRERELRTRVAEWRARAGLSPPAEATDGDTDPLLAALAEVRSGVQEVLGLRQQGERLVSAARDLGEQEQAATARRGRALDAARRVVRALGGAEDNWERALAELEERRQAAERRAVLESTATDLERQVLTAEEREVRRAEAERLRGERARLEREHPEWAAEAPPAGVSRAEVDARCRELDGELGRVRTQRLALERQVGWLEDPAHAQRASDLRLAIQELARELRRAQRFQLAVALAHERLQRVARETNARWSEFLARRVNELLPALGPTMQGFEVADDLEYSLVVGGQRLARERLDQVLSAGARDQLALALRLAVCEFLARGARPLPLVLDDPFANCDDARADAGFRFLADRVARAHQVVLLTCHRARLMALQASDPAWFESHVHCVELPGGASGGVTKAPAADAAPAAKPTPGPAPRRGAAGAPAPTLWEETE